MHLFSALPSKNDLFSNAPVLKLVYSVPLVREGLTEWKCNSKEIESTDLYRKAGDVVRNKFEHHVALFRRFFL